MFVLGANQEVTSEKVFGSRCPKYFLENSNAVHFYVKIADVKS